MSQASTYKTGTVINQSTYGGGTTFGGGTTVFARYVMYTEICGAPDPH